MENFEQGFERYKTSIEAIHDRITVLCMLHAFCMGYCCYSAEVDESDLDPVFDKMNEIDKEIRGDNESSPHPSA